MAREIRVCHYCQRELVGRVKATIDHVVPRAMGGRDERFNKVWSCRDCNGDKGSKWPTCTCNFCRKTRRIHWEMYRIRG